MAFGSNRINPIHAGKSEMIKQHLLRNIRRCSISNPPSIEGMQAKLKADALSILNKNIDVLIFCSHNDYSDNFTPQHREGFVSFMNYIKNNVLNEYVDGILLLNQKMPSGPVYFNGIFAFNFQSLIKIKDKDNIASFEKELLKKLEDRKNRFPSSLPDKDIIVLSKFKYRVHMNEQANASTEKKPDANGPDVGKDGQLNL